MTATDDLISMSLVAHHGFCPRRAWLEAMGETTDTHRMAVGVAAHRGERRSQPFTVRGRRAVDVVCARLGISGRCDSAKTAPDDPSTAPAVGRWSLLLAEQPFIEASPTRRCTTRASSCRCSWRSSPHRGYAPPPTLLGGTMSLLLGEQPFIEARCPGLPASRSAAVAAPGGAALHRGGKGATVGSVIAMQSLLLAEQSSSRRHDAARRPRRAAGCSW
ncbi:hypothetical protein, partial [Pseudonocardia sp.]|uniref:hypothetical protein n=1 Tax=Pseudonocardia sp. TaxID=60912 RepID=UPI003D0F3E21